MPYVDEATKLKLSYRDNQFPETAGELNWLITRLMLQYTEFLMNQCGGKLSYDIVHEVRGAPINASDEYYRKLAAPYEDAKAISNGDVYRDILIKSNLIVE